MQTVGGAREAQGFCRDEFTAWSTYFARPLIMNALRERYEREAADSDFRKTVDHYREALDGAWRRCLPHDDPTHATEADGVWRAATNVPVSAYQPTTGEGQMPFFVTIDRSTAQNFWVVYEKEHIAYPAFPLLQLIRMPPRGHDLHQLVEHAIGVVKRHVRKVFRKQYAQCRKLTTQMAVDAVREGAKRYTAESWSKNFVDLWYCLAIVAALETQKIEVVRLHPDGTIKARDMVPGTAGGFCVVKLS